MKFIILALICTTTCANMARSSKVLVISPALSKSVFFVLNAIAGELSDRGHEVVILAASSEKYLKDHPLVQFYPVDGWWEGLVNGTVVLRMSKLNAIEKLRIFFKMQGDICDSLIGSDILEQHRDAEVLIGLTPIICSHYAAHILKIPHVSVLPAALNIPILGGMGHDAPVAYVPQMESRLSPDMPFFGRLKNFVFYCIGNLFVRIGFYWTANDIITKYNISTDKYFEDMLADTELVLVQGDFALEDAQPLPPNIKLIGPVLPQPAKELDADLEAFMNSAGPEGVVLVSFGSVEISGVRSRTADEVMARALAKLPFKVVWKIKDYEGLPIGSNTKVRSWIKQNDILGHPKTRVFVSHVGHNGMYESAYHGVPIIACPQWGEQFDNTARLVHRGIAVSIDVTDLENLETTLYSAVNKITSDPSYADNMKRLSRIMRSRKRTPREEAADWVEHVLDVKDTSHLKPRGNSMPFYQLYLLDIIFFIVLLVVLFVLCITYCFRCCKRCWKKKEKKN